MTRKTSKLPKFTGELAAPIETTVVFGANEEYWKKQSDQRSAELHKLRVKKMPALARALGIKFDHLDLNKEADMVSFYGCVAMNLAILVCPGFREKERKTSRELVRHALVAIEQAKQLGHIKSDLDGCIAIVRSLEPELAKASNRTRLKQRALTLRNLIAQDRAMLKRAHAKKLH